MVFRPKIGPLVLRLLGRIYNIDQISSEEGARPDSCNFGKSPEHSSGSRSYIKQPSSYPCLSDGEPITPYHLLHGRPMVSLPHRDVQDDKIDTVHVLNFVGKIFMV